MPRFKDAALLNIGVHELQQFATDLRKKVSGKTIVNVLSAVFAVVRYAERCGMKVAKVGFADLELGSITRETPAAFFKREQANDIVAAATPWLTLIAKKVCRLGEQPGQAQAMKLVNNIMLAANMAVASEALTIGAKAGLDADAMIEVIRSSTGNSAAADILARFAICGAFDFGAHMSIVAKDVELAIDEAKALDVPVPVLNEARSLWRGAIEQGRGGDDFTSILKIVEARGGVTVRGVPRR